MKRALQFAIIFGILNFVSPSLNANADKLPHSLDAERSVLGAIVLNNEAALPVLPILRESDFYFPANRAIFQAVELLTANGKPIDLVTLQDQLVSMGKLEAAGGISYICGIADGLPRVSNVEHYAGIVKRKSQLRALIYECDSIAQSAQGEAEPGTIIESAVEKILALASSDSGAPRIIEWHDASQSAVDKIEAARNNPGSVFRGVSGIRALDETLAGLRRTELTLIVGATSNGKSQLASQFAIATEETGYSGLIFSAEMSAESIALRQLAYESDVFFYHVRRPEQIREDHLRALKDSAGRKRKLAIVDQGITPARVFALSEARKRAPGGLDFVIVDYDQLVIDAGIEQIDDNAFFAHQSQFIHRAVKFAKRLDICFILLAQQRKNPAGVKKGAKPQLDDIFGSSAMKNDPDVIMWVVRDYFLKDMNPDYESVAHVYVMKARNGDTKAIEVKFDSKRVRFLDKPLLGEGDDL